MQQPGVAYYAGLSGLQLPVPKYQFPERYKKFSRLAYYSVLNNSIEINSSFYKIPLPITVGRWVNEVHNAFTFTFKVWEGISHANRLHFNRQDVVKFMRSVNMAAEKAGCLLVQFPPGLPREIKALRNLLQEINDHNKNEVWKIAIEFRHPSWYNEDVYEVLRTFNSTIVVHDYYKCPTPSLQQITSFMYLRFHGTENNYGGSYSNDFLASYAELVNEWIKEGKTPYIYFNNTRGNAIQNLETLNKMIQSSI